MLPRSAHVSDTYHCRAVTATNTRTSRCRRHYLLQYNKASALSPWCSVAFNPLDGLLQCCPYVIMLFVVPCHYLTHVFMLFFTVGAVCCFCISRQF
jgi:hypothetical protein